MNERLRQVRKNEKLNLKDFGKRIGVTDAALSRMENGNRNITEQTILSVCREFNVNEEWLRTGYGEIYNEPKEDDFSEISAQISESDPKARQAIIDYWKLSKDDKELFCRFIERFINIGED